MALYGKARDVRLFRGLNTELLHRIIEQQVGYYKVKLDDTPANVYGEAQSKTLIGPVLIKCLLDRGEQTVTDDDFGVDRNRTLSARFFRYDLHVFKYVSVDTSCIFKCYTWYNFIYNVGRVFIMVCDILYLYHHMGIYRTKYVKLHGCTTR